MSIAQDLSRENAIEVTRKETESESNLIGTIGEIRESLKNVTDLVFQGQFVALNASIEAARTQTQHENFSLVAERVRRQSSRTEEIISRMGQFADNLSRLAIQAKSIECQELAFDYAKSIEEVFSGIYRFFNATAMVLAENPSINMASLLGKFDLDLDGMISIYVVKDKGKILIGQRSEDPSVRKTIVRLIKDYQTERGEFIELACFKKNFLPIVTRMGDGKTGDYIVGLIEHDYINQILNSLVHDNQLIYMYNKCGDIIASSRKSRHKSENLRWLELVDQYCQGNLGCSLETYRNGTKYSWGSASIQTSVTGESFGIIVGTPIQETTCKPFIETQNETDTEVNDLSELNNKSLRETAVQIQQEVKSINKINHETNMLAVNAAIQAGIAGDEGEAFSVIAFEIGKLAKTSEEFVLRINQLTRRLDNEVHKLAIKKLSLGVASIKSKLLSTFDLWVALGRQISYMILNSTDQEISLPTEYFDKFLETQQIPYYQVYDHEDARIYGFAKYDRSGRDFQVSENSASYKNANTKGSIGYSWDEREKRSWIGFQIPIYTRDGFYSGCVHFEIAGHSLSSHLVSIFESERTQLSIRLKHDKTLLNKKLEPVQQEEIRSPLNPEQKNVGQIQILQSPGGLSIQWIINLLLDHIKAS